MVDSPLILACADLLTDMLALPSAGKITTREELANFIKPTVTHLLNRDMSGLLHFCYRVDLGEEKFKHILYHSEPDQIAWDLSLAIVDRQLLKLKIRSTYRSTDNS